MASLGFGVPWPQNLLGFVVAIALGTSSLFALALLFAAVVPSAAAATALGLAVFFAVMFLGGVYLPRYLLPEIVNRSARSPRPACEGLQDAWLGAPLRRRPAGDNGRDHGRRRSDRRAIVPLGVKSVEPKVRSDESPRPSKRRGSGAAWR